MGHRNTELTPSKTWKSEKKVNGALISTFGASYEICNMLSVEAGTNGFRGGDSGHGSRTYLSFENGYSTDMSVSINGVQFSADKIELMFGGDCELEMVILALEYAVKTLKNQTNLVTDLSRKEFRQMKFYNYLEELLSMYKASGSLKGMSKLREVYNITTLTKEQFYLLGLNRAVNDKNFCLNKTFANAVYDYVLNKTNTAPIPQYQDFK
jgi:hypothetical protein